MQIGLLGPKGTFCDVALQKFLEQNKLNNATINYFPTISKVAKNMDNNDITILPLENSLDGYVQETLDALFNSNLQIICDIIIPIDFAFVSCYDKYDRLYVQFKAYGQCLDFINQDNLDIYQTQNNVESLEKMLENVNSSAIVPMHLTINKNFKTLIPHVIDNPHNYTRFVVIGKTNKENYQKDKCSLWVCANSDYPGALTDALKIFQKYQINLSCIMSRPTKNELGTYNFYIEFPVENKYKEIEEMIKDFAKEKGFILKVLGMYSCLNN